MSHGPHLASAQLAFQEQMVALVRAFGLLRPDRTPCGQAIPVSEAHALLELGRHAHLSQQELGTRLHLEKSTVSRLVGQLDKRGWIQRERDSEDKRVMNLSLSSNGESAATQLNHARATKFARILNAIPEDERETVMRSLDILAKACHENAL